jgi:pyridoxal 5'-phosphate synthase pdxS subunit
LGEALRRIDEGAAMIRTKGEAGSGNIVEAVRHMNMINKQIFELTENNLDEKASEFRVPTDLVKYVLQNKKLPVPNFAAGGIATPADASLMMQLGAETVFVGSGIFKSSDPLERAKSIVHAVTHYKNSEEVLKASYNLKDAMKGILMSDLSEDEKFSNRGD